MLSRSLRAFAAGTFSCRVTCAYGAREKRGTATYLAQGARAPSQVTTSALFACDHIRVHVVDRLNEVGQQVVLVGCRAEDGEHVRMRLAVDF